MYYLNYLLVICKPKDSNKCLDDIQKLSNQKNTKKNFYNLTSLTGHLINKMANTAAHHTAKHDIDDQNASVNEMM